MNSPLPQDITAECRKAAKIIESFIVPKKTGLDQVIPPQIIAQAKGIAILSVIKAGFLFSGRGGSGIVVARLDDGSVVGHPIERALARNMQSSMYLSSILDGCAAVKTDGRALTCDIAARFRPLRLLTPERTPSYPDYLLSRKPISSAWSAPSAIGTAGFGAGGQIGVEITDFVIILNTKEAVKAFSHGGNVTLGGNLSVAAGPVGRNAEASGSILNLAPIYSYSSTKGLFVGISLEGSVILERKETNASFYRRKVTAKEILSGTVPPPPAAEELYRALNRRTEQEVTGEDIAARRPSFNPAAMFRKDKEEQEASNNYGGGSNGGYNSGPYRTPASSSISSPSESHRPVPLPGRLPAPAPPPSARVKALYDFEGQRDGDLSFRAGEEIIVLQKNANDWWNGRIGSREGVFPANYVQQ
ncbi:hypothetical protein CcCBS67573_g01546 [Chytriomyces confervae]|uniref:SH3 domain-containing protein n=1 Tax=Chytriomyces confervae TaxID=246404 RepID=A0A507FLI0_9FUNG|nr:hypothetical protein CcCBS67573_g01546 [Chytriomyces confervae]